MADRVLLMSHCVPPIVRGPSVVINRLFKRFSKDSYVILTSRFDAKKGIEIDERLRLPCKYYYVNIDTIVGGYNTDFFGILKKWLQVIPIVIKGINVIKREKCGKLLVCPTHGNFFLAAWVMHKVCRTPLYVYFFDLFSSDNGNVFFEPFMRRITQRLALRSAKCAFVMSEKLKDWYQARYPALNIRVIRHPVDRAQYFINNNRQISPNAKSIKIVFTGMIYEYQIDAIQNLAKAVNALDSVQFHIYSQRSKTYLEDMGVAGANIFYYGCLPNDEIIQVQKNADILFLPMSFHGEGTDRDVIMTASPTKIGEYLTSGRPILVHAPEDSYIAWYAKKYELGFVVEQRDAMLLKKAVETLLSDSKLRQRLVANALKASEMYDVGKAWNILTKELALVEKFGNNSSIGG